MLDNGLLKYYREKNYKDGYLLKDDIPLGSEIECIGDRITLHDSPSGRFYIKTPRYFNISQPDVSIAPEVLLGQIYNMAGLKSAIYLPIQTIYGKGVISNDITNGEKNFIDAYRYLHYKIWHRNGPYSSHYLSHEFYDPQIYNYFTRRALMQQAKMRILDVASFNTDRHAENFFYKLTPTTDTHTPQSLKEEIISNLAKKPKVEGTPQVKAEEVMVFDNEMSGLNYYARFNENSEYRENRYYKNDFDCITLAKKQMLEEFRHNELLAELLDKNAFAEELGSISPSRVAQDITETTSYEFDPKYLETLERSYDEVAESLIQ